MSSFTYFEPLHDGHSTLWAHTVLVHAAKNSRISKVALVTNAQMAGRLQDTCQSYGISMEILPAETIARLTQSSLLARGRAQWRTALEIRAQTNGDVFLPFFDHAVIAAALDRRSYSGPGKISGVIFRAPNNYGMQTNWRRTFENLRRHFSYSLAKRKSINTLFTLDETLNDSAGSYWKSALTFLPDLAPKITLLPYHARADGRKIWLLFGSLTARKGIYQMVEAWAMKGTDFHQSNVLRLIGKIAAEEQTIFMRRVNELLKSTPEMLIEIEDQFLNDVELTQEVCNSAVILVPYQNHIGSSGVLYWAAAAGKPVLSQNCGLMGFLVQKYGLGKIVEAADPSRIAKALDQEQTANIDPSFYRGHSPKAFAEALLNGVISI